MNIFNAYSWQDKWRRWRRKIKTNLPFVRRREYIILEKKYTQLIDAVNDQIIQAKMEVRKDSTQMLNGDVCLFVSHCAQSVLKTHVKKHLEHLLDYGIHIILIINTNLKYEDLNIDKKLEQRLSGVYVRENIGFDFGAWAQVYCRLDRSMWKRLYLINDSIVGPLDNDSFLNMMDRINKSTANFLGLTESLSPIRHLQSYFLVFNREALVSTTLNEIMFNMRNFPLKGQVVDIYEINLTQKLYANNLTFEAIFPSLSDDINNSDDTLVRWDRLLSKGFPYLKTRIIQKFPKNLLVISARIHGRVDDQI